MLESEKVNRPRWGDEDEEDEDDILPSNYEEGPDKDGITSIIEFYRNEKNEIIKKSTKVKKIKVKQKIIKIKEDRSQWKKFGLAADGNEGITALSYEDVPFENLRAKKVTLQEKKVQDIKKAMETGNNDTVRGSLKEILEKRKKEREILKSEGLLDIKEAAPAAETESRPAKTSTNAYVPPGMRGKERGSTVPDGNRKYNENSVRVSNLAEEVEEEDLKALFSPFGMVSRVYLAKDKETNRSRGFAFINFTRREDAERAINTINGYGYANLILQCEWATPKEKR